MFTRNTLRASRLALAVGGLVITATVSAADVQSQAQEVLSGHSPTYVAASAATPARSRSTSRAQVDVQRQAADLLGGPSRETGKSPTTRVTVRTPGSLQSAGSPQFSSSQEMAQKLLLGVVGE
jgi:hypothetical protein